MNDAVTIRTADPAPRSRPAGRLLAGLVVAGSLRAAAGGAQAQDATPAAGTPDADRLLAVCDGVTEQLAATPVAAPDAPQGLDQVPADLLAIDTLITHTVAIIDLASVTEAGATAPELVQYAGDARAAAQERLTQLTTWREAWHPGAPQTPAPFQSALLDRSLAAGGSIAGSGEVAPAEGLVRAPALCEITAHGDVPFDVAALDLTLAELQDGVAVALLVSQESRQPELAAFGQTVSDQATADIGTLATWRDQWFGADVPVVTPEPVPHEH